MSNITHDARLLWELWGIIRMPGFWDSVDGSWCTELWYLFLSFFCLAFFRIMDSAFTVCIRILFSFIACQTCWVCNQRDSRTFCSCNCLLKVVVKPLFLINEKKYNSLKRCVETTRLKLKYYHNWSSIIYFIFAVYSSCVSSNNCTHHFKLLSFSFIFAVLLPLSGYNNLA